MCRHNFLNLFWCPKYHKNKIICGRSSRSGRAQYDVITSTSMSIHFSAPLRGENVQILSTWFVHSPYDNSWVEGIMNVSKSWSRLWQRKRAEWKVFRRWQKVHWHIAKMQNFRLQIFQPSFFPKCTTNVITYKSTFAIRGISDFLNTLRWLKIDDCIWRCFALIAF